MYQALYRKYRPQRFDDVVGQLGITQTLKNQLLNHRLSHAYLFTGTRGTGKTTCAKILAKAVNCEDPVDGNPCNCCAACKSIDSGACMDVLEIDAASNNGVDNVRSLREDAIYLPAEVKKRVYIIDEVHMLSISAFNALLKIIEEPPEHLLFILATTELHKVPATILSRCQRFSFRRILPEDIVERLNYIAYCEHVDLEPDAAAFLARLADGGLRDAVSLLDQCASAARGAVTTDEVCRVLGLAGTRKTAELLQAVGKRDTVKALEIFNGQYAEGKDLSAMLDELCSVARDLLILQSAPQSGINLLSGVCTSQELRALSGLFSAGELLRMTAILRDTAAGFHASANRRIDAELCLIRLCEPEAELDAQSLNARLSRLEDKIAAGLVVARQAPVEEEEAPFPTDEDLPPEEPALPPPPPVDETPAGFWPRLVERVRSVLKPPAVAMFVVSQTAPLQGYLQGDVLFLEARDVATAAIVDKPNVLQTVAECAGGLLGRPVRVRVGRAEERKRGGAGLEQVFNFAREHSDIINIK